MTLKLDQIDFKTELPKIPETAAAVRCSAPRFEERERGMQALGKQLDLGKLRELDTRFGRAVASKHGDIEYFSASGAVWSTNIRHDLERDSEFLDWGDLDETKDAEGQPIVSLGRKASAQALDLASEMAEIGGFDMKHADKPQVHLMQVAEADEKGRTIRSGAGDATVAFGYSLDGLPVLGAGGKTLVDLIPGARGLTPTSAINVWRTPKKAVKVKLGGTEAALAAGLLEDPDLNLAAEKGGKISIEKMRYGLMSMPAAIEQGVLFPALEFEARVDMGREKGHYFIGRVVPVVQAKAFESAGLVSEHFGLGM